MASLGIGAMLNMLCGGGENPSKYYGKEITKAYLDDNEFWIRFSDGVEIKILDNGQSCCEHRFITCDDDPSVLIGGKLVKIEQLEGGNKGNDWGDHEFTFIDIATNKAHVKFTAHNEHNGYYGGFAMVIKETKWLV